METNKSEFDELSEKILQGMTEASRKLVEEIEQLQKSYRRICELDQVRCWGADTPAVHFLFFLGRNKKMM